MARAPDNKDLAYKDYMEGMKYKDIASKYNVSMNADYLVTKHKEIIEKLIPYALKHNLI